MFGLFSVKILEDYLELLFVKDVLKVLKFSDLVDEIRLFLMKIVFYRNFRDEDKRLGIVYVFVVDVKCKRKKVIIYEKVIYVFFL